MTHAMSHVTSRLKSFIDMLSHEKRQVKTAHLENLMKELHKKKRRHFA